MSDELKLSERTMEAAYDEAFAASLRVADREMADDEWLGRALWVRRQGLFVRACDACGGTGCDLGSLREAEPCMRCLGGGAEIECAERKAVSRQLSTISLRRIA